MSKRHSYEEISESFALWIEYVDPDGTMAEEEFNELSVDEKIQIQIQAFGEEL